MSLGTEEMAPRQPVPSAEHPVQMIRPAQHRLGLGQSLDTAPLNADQRPPGTANSRLFTGHTAENDLTQTKMELKKRSQLVSLLLIGIAAWGIGFGLISSFRVVGVVIAVGVFLFFIALVGLIGAVKHHQVLLFFYMIILLLDFIVQFSVSCACLALNKEQQSHLLEVGWNNTDSARTDIERNLNCCGFRVFDPNETCFSDCFRSHQCQPCAPIMEEYSGMVLRYVGGIGLFFSFTEILGVWLTYRYRNQKDPRANPSAFL